MSELFIPVLLGTAREGRESEKAAKFIFAEFQKRPEIRTEFLDIRDFLKLATVPSWEESQLAAPWREKAKQMDGLIIVSPEYNHGYPGELKILLDSALKEYTRKPVAVCGVSDGQYAGTRMNDHIKPVLITMGLVPIKRTVLFNNVDTLFTEKGNLKDPEPWQKKANGLFEELIWYSKVLKEGRDKYPEKK